MSNSFFILFETLFFFKIDLIKEKSHADFISNLINKKLISSVNDISDGGLITILTKMSFINNIGFNIKNISESLSDAGFYFSETQARYIISTSKAKEIIELANSSNIKIMKLGSTIANNIIIDDQEITINILRDIYNSSLSL